MTSFYFFAFIYTVVDVFLAIYICHDVATAYIAYRKSQPCV